MNDFLSKLEQQRLKKPSSNGQNRGCGRFILLNSIKSDKCLEYALKSLNKANAGIIIDGEHFINIEYSKKFIDSLEFILYYQPCEQKEMFEVILKLLQYKELDCIVVNSIVNLLSYTIDSKGVMHYLNKIKTALKSTNTDIIVVNPYNNTIYNNLEEYFNIIIDVKNEKIIKNTLTFNKDMSINDIL